MLCDYCENQFSESDIGTFKDKNICFKCATNKGIPADFHRFIEDDPQISDENIKNVAPKDTGKQVVAILIGILTGSIAGYLWFMNPTPQMTYIFIAEGIITGILIRILFKGYGAVYQNIASSLLILSYIVPRFILIQRNPEFNPQEILNDLLFLLGGVFATYVFLINFKKK